MINPLFRRISLSIVHILLIISLTQCHPNIEKQDLTSPLMHPDGRKWRIAYYEAGYYIDYEENLRALIDGLVELGWASPIQIPVIDEENNHLLWDHLALNLESDFIEFVPDAFWSANWQEYKRAQIRQTAIERLNQPDEIDLIIAMGTWAGQDLANDQHAVPTLVLTSSGPLEAGIIEQYDDSGFDHVMVEVDPYRYRRQIQQFHDIVHFERLGVAYEYSPDGRIYGNLADLESVAAERGFTLVTCNAPDFQDNVTQEESVQALAACYKKLAPAIDALWIGAHAGEEPQYMPDMLAPMIEYAVPTWSQHGSSAVQRGVLLSIAQQNFTEAGRWYAQSIARIFNGTTPREIDQVFELPSYLLINLETARQIGFEIPPGLLTVADKTYNTIEDTGGK
jgi:ABC-type uncharacterized transport system substrate-binding protein